jgi:adenylate kinase
VLLGNRKLLYFPDENWQQSARGGAIVLDRSTKILVSTAPLSGQTWVEITNPDRVWVLDAGSEEENIRWLELLNMQIATGQRPPYEVFVCGPPGSGKTTQCERLSKATGAVHISAGTVLRQNILLMTEHGVQAKLSLDRGGIVPDDLVVSMVVAELSRPECVINGWVLDGFPRTVEQAIAMRKVAVMPSKIVVLEIERGHLLERIVGRRVDPKTGELYHVRNLPPSMLPAVKSRLVQRQEDTESKFGPRLEAYRTYVLPILRLYKARVVYIDAYRTQQEVFGDINQAMQGFRDKSRTASLAQHDSDDEEVEAEKEQEQERLRLEEEQRQQAQEREREAEQEREKARQLQQKAQSEQSEQQEREAARIQKLREELKTFKEQLREGFEVLRHEKKGKPHPRLVYCDEACGVVYWQKPGPKVAPKGPSASRTGLMGKAKDNCMELASVEKVVAGMQTEVLKRKGIKAKDAHCFSLIAGKRTLDIETDSAEQHSVLFRGFLMLHDKVKGQQAAAEAASGGAAPHDGGA